MDALTEKMLARVQGLLALSEDETTTQHERDLATQRAAEIMAKYAIDAAMLAAAADKREIPCDKKIRFPNPYGKQHMMLYFSILTQFGGDAIVIDRPTRGRYSRSSVDYIELHVFGFEADLMVVDVLYTSLLLQGIQQSKNPPRYEHARTWRVSFWAGFTATVRKRLAQAKVTARASTDRPGTDIVLRNRALEVRATLLETYKPSGNYSGSTVRSGAGYAAGQDAGRRANLHHTKAAGRTTRAAL